MKGMLSKMMLFLAIIVLATTLLLVKQGRAAGVQPTIDVHRPFLYSEARPAETFGPACTDCHEPSASFYDPQNFLLESVSAASGAADQNHSPLRSEAQYSPIYANDTIIGLWVSGPVGMQDLPIRFSTFTERP